MTQRVLLLAMLLVTLGGPTAHAATTAPLEPLFFLIGEWEASGPDASVGHTTFASSLQGRAIVRTNSATYPASGDRPASRHEDLMVIYVVGTGIRADYYDSEGHTIHYGVSTTPGAAVLLSDLVSSEPRYRLSYKLGSDGALDGAFEIAPPGKPEDFHPYLTWQAHKVNPAGTGAH